MKKPLDRLRLGVWERGIALGKISLSTSLGAGLTKMRSLLANDADKAALLREFLTKGAARLSQEFGELKGSLMKAGQMLSVYGEQFLPPEINAVLKTLQKDSAPVAWTVVEPLLERELKQRFIDFTIERDPVGSASLGQVHRGVERSSGNVFAFKLRYPGVEKAIESDLKLMRKMLGVAGLLPNVGNLDAVFDEARTMLRQEVDYRRELELTVQYRERIGQDGRFVVPRAIPELSTEGLLVTTFEQSSSVDSPEVAALSLERRNRLATAFFELYLTELFHFHAVQTDAHFGNFGVRIDPTGVRDQWVLYDFGAVRELPTDFVESYRKLATGALNYDRPLLTQAMQELQLTVADDNEKYVNALASIAELGMESVRGPGVYCWGISDLPMRVSIKARELLFQGQVRVPRPELLSLDRKTSGVFVVLAKLGAEIETRTTIDRYLKMP